MFKKVVWLNLALVLTIGLWGGFLSFAQSTTDTEKITITTYYPSPFGVYKEMRAKRMAIGDEYVDNSEDYCWEGSCANPIERDADLVVEGKVGIGTMNPQASQDGRNIRLDVTDNIIADDVYLRNPKNGNPRWASEGSDINQIISQIKVCYCIRCHEGDDHPYGGGWKCSENGSVAGPSDDSSASEGCEMKIKLVPSTQPCTW